MTTLPSTWTSHAHEIQLQYKRPLFSEMVFITGSEKAQALLRKCIDVKQLDVREHFWVFFLSNANRVLGFSEVAQGGINGVIFNARYVFQQALLTNACSIIVAHNHPSGVTKISNSDIKMTEKLVNMGTIMDIKVLDHIILTSETYVSLSDEGVL